MFMLFKPKPIDKLYIIYILLKKMHKMVGLKYPCKDLNYKNSDWFNFYEWSIEDEHKFKKWAIKKYKKLLKVNNEIAEKEIDYFILFCGWKIKDEVLI